MEGSILQNLGKRAILATKGYMFVALGFLFYHVPIEWTRRYKLFLGVFMINIMGFLLELIRAKIQKLFHQMEEYVSYANIIRLHFKCVHGFSPFRTLMIYQLDQLKPNT